MLANARLIAAAPDMLAALKYWDDAHKTGRNEPLHIAAEAGRAAIAKAEASE